MTELLDTRSRKDSSIALVTGGGAGIGAAVAERLGADGYHVWVNDLNIEKARETVETIRRRGGSAGPIVANVADAEEVDRMFDVVESFGSPVTALVNNAGVGGNAAIRNVSSDYFDSVTSVNLAGVVNCSRRAIEPMRELRTGSIATIGSRAWLGWWGQTAYAASKAGVVGMSRALAIEVASRNIRVNVVAPGLINTPLLMDKDAKLLKRLVKSVPLGRVGTPQEVAGSVSFLLSDKARMVTGQVLYVCGGKSVYAYPDWPVR